MNLGKEKCKGFNNKFKSCFINFFKLMFYFLVDIFDKIFVIFIRFQFRLGLI